MERALFPSPLVDYFLLPDLAPHLPGLRGRGKQLLAASPCQPLPAPASPSQPTSSTARKPRVLDITLPDEAAPHARPPGHQVGFFWHPSVIFVCSFLNK